MGAVCLKEKEKPEQVTNKRTPISTQDLREPIWRRITFPSESQGKYWFFSNEKVSKAHGYGVLYFFGKYAEYTVQG